MLNDYLLSLSASSKFTSVFVRHLVVPQKLKMFQVISRFGRILAPNRELMDVLSKRGLRHIKFEPDYLDSTGPQIALYDTLNVQIKSYNFTVLESFSSYIHKTAENMGIEVEDCWATPCKKYNIQTFKPNSSQVDKQYKLNVYERNVQITDVPTTTAPIFFSIIQAALPEGVHLKVKPHEDADEELRYVPDLELNQLKNELEALGGPKVTRPNRR